MLLSKDIVSNKKLPDFIREARNFQVRSKFEKVFPDIGLRNVEANLNDVVPGILDAFKSAAIGVRANLPFRNTLLLPKILALIIKYFLMFADIMLDYLFLWGLKQQDPKSTLKVVFSANGFEGAWDIATMSMRGISSCQSWDAGQSRGLVGSITDPFCGLVFLTNGQKTKYGREMKYRSVVRYIVHHKIGPCLFMERTYPHAKRSHNVRAASLAFAKFLSMHTKLPIVYDYCMMDREALEHSFIPTSNEYYDDTYMASYRDSALQYAMLTDIHLKKFPEISKITKYARKPSDV